MYGSEGCIIMSGRFIDLLNKLQKYFRDCDSKEYKGNILHTKLLIQLKTDNGVLCAYVNDVELFVNNKNMDLEHIILKGAVGEGGQVYFSDEELEIFNDYIRGE